MNITVLDVNDNTPIFDDTRYTGSVSEAALAYTSITRLSATDADETTNAEIRFIIESGVDSDDFLITPITGEVFVNAELDRETRSLYNLVIGAVDQGFPSNTGFVNLNIAISDVNDNKPNFTQSTFYGQVFENEDSYTVFIPFGDPSDLLYITATDADIDINAVIEYEIISSDDFRIRTEMISGAFVGVIETARELDREVQDKYVLTLRAIDGGGLTSATLPQVVINVLDRDDSIPEFDEVEYFVDLTENGDSGEYLITVSATELDSAANNTNIKFRISSVMKVQGQLVPICYL